MTLPAARVSRRNWPALSIPQEQPAAPKGLCCPTPIWYPIRTPGLRSIVVAPGDVFLSFLPLSHALERTVGYYAPLMAGARVAFTRSIQDLAEDLMDIRPTVLISVPRIFERIYSELNVKLEQGPAIHRILIRRGNEDRMGSISVAAGQGQVEARLHHLAVAGSPGGQTAARSAGWTTGIWSW